MDTNDVIARIEEGWLLRRFDGSGRYFLINGSQRKEIPGRVVRTLIDEGRITKLFGISGVTPYVLSTALGFW